MIETRKKRALNIFVHADLKEALEAHAKAYGISQAHIVNQILRTVFIDSNSGMSEKEKFLNAGQEMIETLSGGEKLSEKDKEELKAALRQVLNELGG